MVLVKKVAVIGAGLSGVAAIKSLKEEGIEPVCFEKTGHAGGLWKYRDEDIEGMGSVMKTCVTNTSKELSAVSNCPPPDEHPNYMHHTVMYDYILYVAKKFDCLRHIKYNHETVRIEKAGDYEKSGRWQVTNLNHVTKDLVTEVFDAVMICTGHQSYPHVPVFKDQEKFQGKIIHMKSLKKVDEFEDQDVVVVGIGNSACDAAVELTSVARKVFLSFRRAAWISPRLGAGGYPLDVVYLRRWFYVVQYFIPYTILCTIAEKIINGNFNQELYNLRPKHRLWSQHPVINDFLPVKLLSGRIVTRDTIDCFTQKGVKFRGQKEETKVDAVVLATGYKIKFPFLDDNIFHNKQSRVRMYKFIFPPHLPHPTLAFIGFLDPAGPAFPTFEMQCRWSISFMTGKLRLPSETEMLADIKKKEDFNRKNLYDSERHLRVVRFIPYQDELAEEIGAKPNFLKIAFTDLELLWALICGPSMSYQYRLRGPHSWDGARDAILTYHRRVAKPLEMPAEKTHSKTSSMLNSKSLLKLLYLLPILFYMYLWIFS